ncbi:MAG: hypothetical protein RLW68_16565 [Devosia marina]|jgi:hypothetical protein|uniref:hypothetical protein n=1 Tax=Devosia marina TaxID=2683198 RepID=UPI000D5F17AF
MSRRRVAIARFIEKAAADRVRRALLDCGGHPLAVTIDASRSPEEYQVEVELVEAVERALLNVLLSSEAVRVDVHDAD